MERSEKFIHIWNRGFPNYPLTVADLKKPQSMIGAFLEVFNRLDIDNEAILSPPPEEERDEHTMYYWDLLPVINMVRVMNHVVSALQQADKLSFTFPLTITYFLQPDATTSHSILLLLVNLTAFNEDRLRELAPFEEKLFGKRDQVISLEEQKNKLLEMLNQQAEEKGARAGRLEKIDKDIKQLEEELRLEKEAHNEDKKELETVLEENRQLDVIVEQKKTHRDALMAEVARKRALRVYDADDIKSQVEQAAQSVQEAEEKLNSLKATLMQKENSLMNLQKIKPNLDLANNLLIDLMKLTESMRELETGDLDMDSKEGELDVLNTELCELQTQLSELQAARAEFIDKRVENEAHRQQQKAALESSLKEAEDEEKKCLEKSKKSEQFIQEIKKRIIKHEEEKKIALDELDQIKKKFITEIKSFEDALLKKMTELGQKLEKRLHK